ncbi:MAG: hypothetical protein HYW09_00750 [Candidatus Niyogibacteria bacterium]|nr:hypothetical protein [Candidatus Niyogibacteria bacterium]
MMRILATILLVLSLFLLPWIVVFAGVFLSAAVFSWYIEAFLVGFIAFLVAGAPLWKIFLIFALAIFIQEKLKTRMNFSRPVLSVFYLWLAGFLSFVFMFLVLA